MLADTDAIRALGAANSAHAADLATVANALSLDPDVGATLGPVGARFVAVLAEAAAEAARAVTALADRLEAGGRTANASAVVYENADGRVGARVSGVY
jgi:hypothetical protein